MVKEVIPIGSKLGKYSDEMIIIYQSTGMKCVTRGWQKEKLKKGGWTTGEQQVLEQEMDRAQFVGVKPKWSAIAKMLKRSPSSVIAKSQKLMKTKTK
ncbi:hypothetical protein HK104_011045 [Borealophlyctis nickersoniae]|nr:hypothetical protein HK104_011045 [Borealophlyctis nickersoniae]